jgi:hypothetical protein
MSPSWKERFGGKLDDILSVAREENKKSTEVANRMAGRHGWGAPYDPWGTEPSLLGYPCDAPGPRKG